MKKIFRASVAQWNRNHLRFPLNDLQEIFCRNSLISLFKNTRRMRFIFSTLICCLILQVLACGQVNKISHANGSINQASTQLISRLSNFDNLPLRYQETKKQWQNIEKMKKYGEYVLRPLSPFIYAFTDDDHGIEIRSEVDNIVMHKHRKGNLGEKIEFYEQGKLFKTVMIDTLNPYGDLLTPAIDLSHLEGKLMLNRFKNKETINKKIAYTASSWRHYSSQNLYATIAFSFESRNEDGIPVKWEESLFTFNQKGEIIFKIKVSNDLTAFYISEDFKHYAYIFGGPLSEDFESSKCGIFRLFETQNSTQIFQSDAQYSFNGIYEIAPNLIQLHISENYKKDEIIDHVIDLDTQTIVSLFDDKVEWTKYYNEYKHDMVKYIKGSKLINLKFLKNEK